MQGHIHTLSNNGTHTHSMANNGTHAHSEYGFQLTNCDWCGGCTFKPSDCTGQAVQLTTSYNGDHSHAIYSAGDHTHAVSDPASDGTNGTPQTASETRPTNMAVVFIMRVV